MGAFFLYDTKETNELNLKATQNIFTNKGFGAPHVFTLGNNELWLYEKQLVNAKNYYIEGENSIYVIGTVVYKSYNYQDSLKWLLRDYLHNQIKYNHLIGSYCLIIYSNHNVNIINDALNVCKLFTDRKGSFISSSFLAAANAIGKLTIDRYATIEKLLTGYIVGTNTLFHEIKKIVPQYYDGNWRIHKWPRAIIPKADNNREQSIEDRVKVIKSYMRSIKKLGAEYKPELGLSGGYDSRLIFAASQKAWPYKLDLHTHSTEGVGIHNIEKDIVKDIADKTGSKLTIIPTHSLDYYSNEEIESILKDGYYYFDGRCAYNMGAFSPTYTRQYKVDTMCGHGLTLNGLGGEVYRNYYMNIKPFVSTKQWMMAMIYPGGIHYIVDKKTFNAIHKYIVDKMNDMLPDKCGKWVTNFCIKRYYSEMRMPDCDALNCNANNQVEFYLTPFIERKMILDAYKSRRFIGISGEFQSELINKCDPIVASFNSHYGFSFNRKEPLKYKTYMLVRGILPDNLWNLRIDRMVSKGFSENTNKDYFERVESKCDFLKKAAQYTEKMFPEINFDYLRTDYAMMPNSSYISVVLYMLRDLITEKR